MTPKDVLTNPYFCPMPWTGLMYNFDGNVKNCIRSAETIGNLKDNSIEQILLGPQNMQTQLNVVSKEPSNNCKPCYDLDRNKKGFNHISDRVFYIRELKSMPPETYTQQNFDLQTIDVRWTNLCNFACTYCNPSFSSKWADELKVTQSVPTDEQRAEFKEYIFKHAPGLKHVYLAGGEPLLMKENLELLDLLDPEVNLRINTNLSKVDTRVFERICEFKNVHWIVSLETIEDEFEYIRFGGKWEEFLDNLSIIKQLDHKISFNMQHFLLNSLSVFDCVDYLINLGFHNNSFIIGPMVAPEFLNIRHLPEEVLDQVRRTLKQRIDVAPGYLLEDSYRNMLNYLDQPFAKDLASSLKQIQEMDQRRGLNSKVLFKELYEYC